MAQEAEQEQEQEQAGLEQADTDRRQRAAAANAYDRGSEAFLAGDYADAARWFELANRFLASAPALRQAARAHLQAGNHAQAATVARRLHDEYQDDPANAAIANEILEEHEGSLLRVVVHCEQCSILVDGAQIDWHDFYVEPDVEHNLTAEFNTGERERKVSGVAGKRIDLHLQPPPAPPEQTHNVDVTSDHTFEPSTPQRDGGISPAFTYVGIGLTVLAGGALTWSAIDMYSQAEEYDDALAQAEASGDQADLDRAERLLEEGDKLETRTEILIGATAGLAATTIVFAILGNWSGDPDDDVVHVTPGVALSEGGASLRLSGTF